jgi:leader peptidase (prepilin peptidase) / N-methyltransferase
MAVVILGFAGLYLGSLTNLLAGRLAAGRLACGSTIWGRSACTRCGHTLAPWDLVPVVSWLLLRGRCRYCGGRIDDSPIVEAAMPAFFAGSFLLWPAGRRGLDLVAFAAWLALGACAIGLAAYVWRRRRAGEGTSREEPSRRP